MVVDHTRDCVRIEETLPAEILGRQHITHERLHLPSQPGRTRNRESALLAVDDSSRHERLGGALEKSLLRQPPDLEAARQSTRELLDGRV
jgi:hypothetical protein